MFLKLVLFLTFSTTLIIGGNNNFETCGISPSIERYKVYNPDRVFGGEEATEGDWPWIVRLILVKVNPENPQEGHLELCSGSIISNKWILTASHCVDNALGVVVFYGSVNTSQQEYVKAKKWIVHENYIELKQNDIALIELPEPLNYTKNIQPICLNATVEPYENEIIVDAGFGTNMKQINCTECNMAQHAEYFETEILQDSPLAYKTLGNCELGNETVEFDNQTICTSGINHSPLPGDSGGPLMVIRENRWIQIGIANIISMDAIKDEKISVDFIGLFAKVNSFCDWITEKTNGAASC